MRNEYQISCFFYLAKLCLVSRNRISIFTVVVYGIYLQLETKVAKYEISAQNWVGLTGHITYEMHHISDGVIMYYNKVYLYKYSLNSVVHAFRDPYTYK